MGERPPTHPEPSAEPEPSLAAQVAVGAASLGEFFLRDQLVGGTVFFSLISLLATLVAPGAGYVVALVLVGLPGFVLPWVALARRWRAGRTWLVLGALLVLNVVALVTTISAS